MNGKLIDWNYRIEWTNCYNITQSELRGQWSNYTWHMVKNSKSTKYDDFWTQLEILFWNWSSNTDTIIVGFKLDTKTTVVIAGTEMKQPKTINKSYTNETGQGAIDSETSAWYKLAQACLVNTRHIRNKWSRELAGVDCSTELVSRFSESVNLEYNGPVLNDYLLRFKDLGGIS